MDVRPTRCYLLRFETPGAEGVEIPACGHTPCAARGLAFTALEGYLQRNLELPQQGWKLIWQRQTS